MGSHSEPYRRYSLLVFAIGCCLVLALPSTPHANAQGIALSLDEPLTLPSPIPETPCTPSPMQIAYGQVIPCEINPIGETDIFILQGNRRRVISVLLVNRSTDSGPCVQMTDPHDEIVIPDTCVNPTPSGLVVFKITLQLKGTYTIKIHEHADNELNSYVLSVMHLWPW